MSIRTTSRLALGWALGLLLVAPSVARADTASSVTTCAGFADGSLGEPGPPECALVEDWTADEGTVDPPGCACTTGSVPASWAAVGGAIAAPAFVLRRRS